MVFFEPSNLYGLASLNLWTIRTLCLRILFSTSYFPVFLQTFFVCTNFTQIAKYQLHISNSLPISKIIHSNDIHCIHYTRLTYTAWPNRRAKRLYNNKNMLTRHPTMVNNLIGLGV